MVDSRKNRKMVHKSILLNVVQAEKYVGVMFFSEFLNFFHLFFIHF
jgi:hypothetical protein